MLLKFIVGSSCTWISKVLSFYLHFTFNACMAENSLNKISGFAFKVWNPEH